MTVRETLSVAVRRYLDEHAIGADVAVALGIYGKGAEIGYPYETGNGERFYRRRNLNEGKTLQPAGQSLELWCPVEVDGVAGLIVCEGEPDCAAAVSALYEVRDGKLCRRPDLPPPLLGLVPIAVPGVGSCHAKVAALKRASWIAFDGDDPGRTNATKLAEKVCSDGGRARVLNLPDGRDLADCLREAEDPVLWLADRIAALDAREESPPVAPPPVEPVQPATTKFIARRLAEELAAETPVATSASGDLHVFRDGVYRPNGHLDLKERIAARLGDEWKRNRRDETIEYLRDSSPRLWASPPRDRINCANGIVDLEGRLEPHSPDFLSSIQIPVAFDPEATCPEIDKFLGEVLAPDLVHLIYEVAGYLLIPDQSLQVALMFLGEGANGKSTLLNMLTRLIGGINVASVPLHRLDEDRFAVAELEGKLANVFADLDARALNSSSMFKAITGGDAVTGERKYANPFTFTPYARLLFSANEPPPTPDSSDAFFRRWIIVPFERRFDPDKADRRLLSRITAPGELSGLLNRGLDALGGLKARGAFTATDSGVKAKERFRIDADSVAGFVNDSCQVGPDLRHPQPRFYDAYKNWCGESNRKPLGKQKFNRRLEQMVPGVAATTSRGVRYWAGIAAEGVV